MTIQMVEEKSKAVDQVRIEHQKEVAEMEIKFRKDQTALKDLVEVFKI